jgi:hypothetical protein
MPPLRPTPSVRGVEFEGEPDVRPYGTGVLMKDLYGNKIYINQV